VICSAVNPGFSYDFVSKVLDLGAVVELLVGAAVLAFLATLISRYINY
jgi:hypothetical protein